MKTKPDKQILDEMSKDPGNWKGPIYFNRKDSRFLVPKQYPSLGWTFNFANPYAYIILGACIIIVIVINIFSK
jgi:uncharacterized membrane protein